MSSSKRCLPRVAGASGRTTVAAGSPLARASSGLDGSQPYLGQVGQVEHVAEWKVELVVADELIHASVKALKAAHPYETPAYEVWRLTDMVF